jgi:hypothetical protein
VIEIRQAVCFCVFRFLKNIFKHLLDHVSTLCIFDPQSEATCVCLDASALHTLRLCLRRRSEYHARVLVASLLLFRCMLHQPRTRAASAMTKRRKMQKMSASEKQELYESYITERMDSLVRGVLEEHLLERAPCTLQTIPRRRRWLLRMWSLLAVSLTGLYVLWHRGRTNVGTKPYATLLRAFRQTCFTFKDFFIAGLPVAISRERSLTLMFTRLVAGTHTTRSKLGFHKVLVLWSFCCFNIIQGSGVCASNVSNISNISSAFIVSIESSSVSRASIVASDALTISSLPASLPSTIVSSHTAPSTTDQRCGEGLRTLPLPLPLPLYRPRLILERQPWWREVVHRYYVSERSVEVTESVDSDFELEPDPPSLNPPSEDMSASPTCDDNNISMSEPIGLHNSAGDPPRVTFGGSMASNASIRTYP